MQIMHVQDYIFIYIEQYLWWHLCMERMLPTSADYRITVDQMRKWHSTVRRLSSSTCACWHACVLHSLVPGPWTCPRLSCGFRLRASTQPAFVPGKLKAQFKCSTLKVKVKVSELCPILCHPMDGSPWNSPGQNTGVGRWGLYWLLWATFSSLTLIYLLYTVITATVVFLFAEM